MWWGAGAASIAASLSGAQHRSLFTVPDPILNHRKVDFGSSAQQVDWDWEEISKI
jgi:hypothetical protein